MESQLWRTGTSESGGYQRDPLAHRRQAPKGENTIEWQAGKLRTHYWLRKAQVEVTFQAPVEVRFSTPEVEHALFWEGRFDQCSYNALATVLDHFYGVEAWNKDRESYEKRVFVSALDKFGLVHTTAGHPGRVTWPKRGRSGGTGVR